MGLRAHAESAELREMASRLLAKLVVMPSGTPVWEFPAWICQYWWSRRRRSARLPGATGPAWQTGLTTNLS